MLRDFKFLTTAEVAERLRVSYWTAGKLIRERAIGRYKLFEHFVVHEDDLLAYLSKQRQPAMQKPPPRPLNPNMRRDHKRRRPQPAKDARVLQSQTQETTI
jgi:excisionase family DNA binding protein